jgi:tRNA/tmRNA/rRNA uracil-C5-methylase (TrmA/RlmC/RlmD family)
MSAQKLDITRLGGQGDGIAETPAGQIFVPFTVPGDVINAGVEKSRASLIAVLEPSPDRVTRPARISDRTRRMPDAAAARCSMWLIPFIGLEARAGGGGAGKPQHCGRGCAAGVL